VPLSRQRYLCVLDSQDSCCSLFPMFPFPHLPLGSEVNGGGSKRMWGGLSSGKRLHCVGAQKMLGLDHDANR
jgi:hypothetical protein